MIDGMVWRAEFRPPDDEPFGWAVGHSIDSPRSGHRGVGYAVTISGWVIGQIAPATEVHVLFDDALLRRTPVDRPRGDVAAAHPGEPAAATSGFRVRVGLLGLPPVADLELCAMLADGSPVHLGTLRIEHRPVPIERPPRLTPLLVTSLGRMGTTWLMRLLGAHHEIVVHERYPHELGVARYWGHLLRVTCDPADYASSSHVETFAAEGNWIGHNPFFGDFLAEDELLNDWMASRLPVLVGGCLQHAADELYGRMAIMQRRPEARLFAEKSLPDHLPYVFADLYPGLREVILVRDIRDVLCSAVAFNGKRGQVSFGRELLDDDASFVAQLHQDFSRLVLAWRRRHDRALLVRYEELILAPERTLTALFDHLGLASGPEIVQQVLETAQVASAEMDAHRTSRDARDSIGRWQTDLAAHHPELLAQCEALCADLLGELGYPAPVLAPT